MSFFAHPYTAAEPSFTPLFRLLDQFDNHYTRLSPSTSSQTLKTFQPKFDVEETSEAYELHGELAGVEQKDVVVEFTDAGTLVIRGRTERTYQNGTNPAGQIEGEASTTPKAVEPSRQPTIEDEDATSNEITKANTTQQPEPTEEGPKYWISERSIGEFTRSFSFPAKVDQDAVKASMKNGILSIVVPKAKKAEGRKIAIE